MKDFIKIFFLVCALAGSFLFGRNYGEVNYKQSKEYQEFLKIKDEQNYTKGELENTKTKFQNIIDGADKKNSEELLAQILQVFLTDLGLRIQEQKTFTKEGSAQKMECPLPGSEKKSIVRQEEKNQPVKEEQAKKEKVFDSKRLKSYEWILQNAQNNADIKNGLKNVEIKDIDLIMKSAVELKPKELENIFGSYRGRMTDVTDQEYGSMLFEINPLQEDNRMMLKGSIKIFKDGKQIKTNNFTTGQKGYQVPGTVGVIIDEGNLYFQIYKIKDTQQMAGYYYERLVNGTTKTIASFTLNRVDQF